MAGTTVGGTHAELLAKRCMSGGPASWVIEQNSTVNTLANGSLATQATTGPQQLSTTVVQGDRINLTNAGWFHRNRCVRDQCVTVTANEPRYGKRIPYRNEPHFRDVCLRSLVCAFSSRNNGRLASRQCMITAASSNR